MQQSLLTISVKRVLDVVLGTVLAILALPVMFLLACCVAAALREWPFFVQHRMGKDGRMFAFPKLRTLPRRIPKYALKYEWDVELSRFAQFLRRSHLDELPQLLIVPIGWMSLVGPRPKLPDFVEPVDDIYNWTRTSIAQGCTGLWQIGPHTHRLPGESPEFDFYYVENMSVRLDLWILWRTVLTIFGIGRPVGLSEIPSWTRRGAARSAAARATASVLTEDREVAPEMS